MPHLAVLLEGVVGDLDQRRQLGAVTRKELSDRLQLVAHDGCRQCAIVNMLWLHSGSRV